MCEGRSRIAFFLPDLGVGGAEKVFTQLLNEFSLTNFKIDLLLSQDVGEFRQLVNDNVETTAFCNQRRSKPILLLCSLFGLFRFVKKHRPIAVYSTLTGANIVSLLVSLALHSVGTKFIIREANVKENNGWMYNVLSRFLYNEAYRVVAVSEGVKNDLIRNFGVCTTKIVVIKNPVDIEYIKERSRETLSEPWLNDEKTPIIISVGRLYPQKDFQTLIKAFKLVRDTRDAKLVIIGDGPERGNLEQLIARLKLKNHVILLGIKNNPFVYVKNADVFVLSSKWEGFPNVLLEALALGRPIVATDCHSGPAELLTGIDGCRLVPVGNVEAMAEAVLSELEEPVGVVNAEQRLSEFSIEYVAESYKQLLV